MWKVPLFDTDLNNDEIEAVVRVIRSGWLTMGQVTESFEKSFAEFIGAKHAIAVASGTAALHLANLALGVSAGDEVICPSLTFVACANSIVHTGARPVFAEITGPDDFNISPDDIERKITRKTKAIEVVHYAGFPCDMKKIKEIAGSHGLSIIEDCAHAHGTEYDGKKCGTIGDIGCFSFFTNKNMTTVEGGMVTTECDELAAKIRLMRSHGMTTSTLDRHRGHAFSYNVIEPGLNYRIDEVRSSIGKVQLKKLAEYNVKRRGLAQLYSEQLSFVPGLSIPFKAGGHGSSHHIYPVLLEKHVNREALMGYLRGKGIQTSIHYPPIHRFAYYREKLNYDDVRLELTEDVAGRELTLPLFPLMGEDAVHYVCDEMIKFTRKGVNQL
jgi:dTDP-4-amino-4,6-dideoxygalactose transaminase